MTTPAIELPGIVDLHVHFGPVPIPPEYSSVTHSVTAIEAARDAAEAGFRAIVLKAKYATTVGLASAAEEVVDGVRVFGGLVLDYAVGGLNPAAVEQTLLLGGKVVWLPTTGSRQDCHLHGFPSGHGRAPIDGRPGIPVVDDDGRLLPVMHEIFDLITEHDAVLATGHTTLEEHYAVARAFGSTGRVIATHVGVQNAGPGLDVAQCAELAGLGLLMEFSALTAIDHMGKAAMPMAENAALIRAAGVDHAILSSDYGWYHELPRPVPGLQAYFGQLWDAGFTEDELRRMACDTPARLIGLA